LFWGQILQQSLRKFFFNNLRMPGCPRWTSLAVKSMILAVDSVLLAVESVIGFASLAEKSPVRASMVACSIPALFFAEQRILFEKNKNQQNLTYKFEQKNVLQA
jgi:hypothetical protein